MDTSCQTEIVGLGIKIGKGSAAIDINTANFKHLTQYIRERQFRERTLVPIAGNKMDVGAVGVSSGQSQQPYGNGQQNMGGQAYGWDWSNAYGGADGGSYAAFGGGPAGQWNWEWDYQQGGGDLDAMRGGKDKGGEKKPLDCHNCG